MPCGPENNCEGRTTRPVAQLNFGVALEKCPPQPVADPAAVTACDIARLASHRRRRSSSNCVGQRVVAERHTLAVEEGANMAQVDQDVSDAAGSIAEKDTVQAADGALLPGHLETSTRQRNAAADLEDGGVDRGTGVVGGVDEHAPGPGCVRRLGLRRIQKYIHEQRIIYFYISIFAGNI